MVAWLRSPTSRLLLGNVWMSLGILIGLLSRSHNDVELLFYIDAISR